MQRLNWVKFYFTDWMLGVRRMSWAARGVYMEALSLQFHGERLDAGFVAWEELFPGVTEPDYEQVVRHFEERTDEAGAYLVNRRLEEEMRASKIKSDKARANAKRMHSGRRANAERMQSGRSAIRGDKRRVDEKRTEETDCGADAHERDRTCDRLRWSASSGWEGIADDSRTEWAEVYGVDVDLELRAAHQWLVSNPARARKRNWRKFLTNWLARASTPRTGTAGRRDESHIPDDCHPDDRRLWFMPDGRTPRMPLTYRRKDGTQA